MATSDPLNLDVTTVPFLVIAPHSHRSLCTLSSLRIPNGNQDPIFSAFGLPSS